MVRRGANAGQATSEYVALVALVAVVLALAAGLTSGGLGSHVLAGLQRGLCRVAGTPCPRAIVPRADLAPCPLLRSDRIERLSETIAALRLGTSTTLAAARGSDGRVTITLANGSDVGAELGVGVRLGLGRSSLGGRAQGSIAATWTSGRSWTLPGDAAARRFVATYGAKGTIGGRFVDELRSRCSLLCDALGWDPHAQLPEPDETYEEGGESAVLSAAFGLAGEAGATFAGLLGRRVARDGATTWYVRLDEGGSARLGPLALAGSGGATLSYTLDAAGRPATLAIQRVGELGAGLHALAHDGSANASADARLARLVELDATLDLREPANRAVAGALLDGLHERRLLAGGLDALAARIAARGQLDRRTYAVARSASALGATLGLGVELGGGFERTTSGLRLLSAETRLPGLPFLPRDDCRPR